MRKFLKIFMISLLALPCVVVAKGEVVQPQSDTIVVAKQAEYASHSLRRQNRGISNLKTEFVPKGQWVFGGSVSYSTHTNNNYTFILHRRTCLYEPYPTAFSPHRKALPHAPCDQ